MSNLTPEQRESLRYAVRHSQALDSLGDPIGCALLDAADLVAVDERLEALEQAVRALVDPLDAGHPDAEDCLRSQCVYCGGEYEVAHEDGNLVFRWPHAPDCPIRLARTLLEAATATPTAQDNSQPV